jgi:hypothetical protein
MFMPLPSFGSYPTCPAIRSATYTKFDKYNTSYAFVGRRLSFIDLARFNTSGAYLAHLNPAIFQRADFLEIRKKFSAGDPSGMQADTALSFGQAAANYTIAGQ